MKLPFMMDLTSKVAVITGGGGVLGSAFAKAIAQCGAKVAIVDLNRTSAEGVAAEICREGGVAIAVEANVLVKDSLTTALVKIHKELGPCDILLNGAGGNHPAGTTTKEYLYLEDMEKRESIQTFFDLEREGVEFVFNLNFLGTLLPTQIFTRDMVARKQGIVINISSMNAYTPLTKIPAYSGAKAAVSNFTQWLAVHMSKVGIRVNAIAPGFFLTEQTKGLLQREDGTLTERAQKVISQTPMGRFGEPQELIGTLLWLLSEPASGFVNGAVIPVDGGFSAYSGV
ncbi:NAD(P)-dependent dehydrogenase, short-chain alcohol dehydrogenase family [Pelosinus fermentans]|uniref:SDR family oxidoreductase n=1 Tax=Pelosinus fermentans TaxID=365349 RepID=UPI00026863EB|nr:SDR family oxidoreductase [Pelosinus fermentans]OAM92469.1 3-oxoacyl-(acyl-carrier-protein) reductase [Pelosinus fermentans DSM 17108]SDQ45911.1 NAD(P)-dependent dehydrogenase, short-chain alcohol dehydrogenase family [Pelosinus fermentans]